MIAEIQNAVILILPLFLQLVGLTFAVLADSYIRREHRKIMLIIIVVIFSLIVQNLSEYVLNAYVNMPYIRTLVGIYGYSARPVIIVLFFYVVSRERKFHRIAWILIGINTAIYFTSVFSGICFYIDANNNFHRGPFGYSCHIVSALLLSNLVYITIREYSRAKDKKYIFIPIFNAALIFAAISADSAFWISEQRVTFLTIAVVNCSVFYYIWLHLQFVREHERALVAEQRIQIMISQIQPHFLYNTLSTIQALCRTDPKKAFDTIEKFGTYLRQNIDSLSRPDLISIKKEIEHTKIYADIEMTRFANVRVEYEILDDDFSLPALTVQPLVENAIRHGVRIRERGVVSVTTIKKPEFHEIIIRDNGRGFDVSKATSSDETHIGIRNVRERIEKMCGGTLNIESFIGEGTTVYVHIPDFVKSNERKGDER